MKLEETKDLGVVGIIARFKPVHKGHAAILEALCERADLVYIGLGSPNKYDVRNPFSAKESEEMIDLVLKPKYSNYSFIEVPDLDNGPKWSELVPKLFGDLDHFITANNYVASLLKDVYNVIHTLNIVPEERRFFVSGTMVRTAMAKGEPWENLVPAPVVDYIKQNGLAERFCREFGLATIVENSSDALEGQA